MTPTQIPLAEIVQSEPEHACDKLKSCRVTTVTTKPGICSDWFCTLLSELTVVSDMKSQRLAKAFFCFTTWNVACVGFTSDNDAKNPVSPSHSFKCKYLFIDPLRSGRIR